MGVFTARIASNNDDAHGRSTYWWNFNSIATGKDTTDITTALRWANVTLPNTAIISSATIQLHFSGGLTNAQTLRIVGIAEDDTADFSGDPRGRAVTSAYADVTVPAGMAIGDYWTSGNIAAAIQEVISRSGWSSGNHLGIFILNNGSAYSHDFDAYNGYPTTAAFLTINYTLPSYSPSVSPSASASPSATSASPSLSPSVSVSPSKSPSISPSASPSIAPVTINYGLKISKPGVNVLTAAPKDLIFSSAFNTIKTRVGASDTITVSGGDTTKTITHNFGIVPAFIFYYYNGSRWVMDCPNIFCDNYMRKESGAVIMGAKVNATQFIVRAKGTDGTYAFQYELFYEGNV
jgi:hypothetical protein